MLKKRKFKVRISDLREPEIEIRNHKYGTNSGLNHWGTPRNGTGIPKPTRTRKSEYDPNKTPDFSAYCDVVREVLYDRY